MLNSTFFGETLAQLFHKWLIQLFLKILTFFIQHIFNEVLGQLFLSNIFLS